LKLRYHTETDSSYIELKLDLTSLEAESLPATRVRIG